MEFYYFSITEFNIDNFIKFCNHAFFHKNAISIVSKSEYLLMCKAKAAHMSCSMYNFRHVVSNLRVCCLWWRFIHEIYRPIARLSSMEVFWREPNQHLEKEIQDWKETIENCKRISGLARLSTSRRPASKAKRFDYWCDGTFIDQEIFCCFGSAGFLEIFF